MKAYLLLFILFSLYYAEDSVKKTRVLILLDNSIYQVTHSLFFKDLENNGYTLDFKAINSQNLKFKDFGEYLYDHMIIMASGEIDGKGLTKNKLLDFFDSGHNIFIASDIDASKFFRQIYNEFGVDIDELGSHVLDHFNKVNESDQSLIYSHNLVGDARSYGEIPKNPILYRGVGLTFTNYETYQIYGILRGESTTYSYNEQTFQRINSGNNVVLVGSAQGRNNARIILTGSIEMLSNEFYSNSKFSNQEFVNNIIRWNFNENGLLKVGAIHHHKIGEKEIPNSYKTEDQLEYTIELYRWNYTEKEWIPYISPHEVMLEFVMLDPYIRMPLVKDIGSPVYRAQFQVPDKYGVFQFKLTYNRPGYTYLNAATKVTVRPPKHNEYDRFLQQAYPYYFGLFGTIFGVVIFICFFLFDDGKVSQTSKEK